MPKINFIRKETRMPKINFIQVDEESFIGWSDLDELARRALVLSSHPRDQDCSKEFLEALYALRMNLLNVSKLIKEGRTWKC